jgi:hypothetical protein
MASPSQPMFSPGTTAAMESGIFPMDFSTGYGSLANADDGGGWSSFMDQLGMQQLQNSFLGMQPLQQGQTTGPSGQLPVF